MKIINTKKRVLVSGIILIVLWLNYFLVSFFLRDDNNSLHHFIPADSNISMRINNDVLVRRMLYDLFYQSSFSEDELKVLTFKGESTTLPSLGIDVTKEIVLFYEDWNNKSIVGWLFHISDVNDFEKYSFDNPSIIKSQSGKMGCALILSSEPTKEEASLFVQYANDLLIPTKELSETKRFFTKDPNDALIQFFFEGEKGGFLQKTGINISFHNEQLLINGFGKKNPLIDYSVDSLHYIEKPNVPNYLEVKAGELPDTIRKYVNFLLESSNLELPVITSQHLMMYGVEIDNIKGSMAVLPKFDAIFRFEGQFSFEKIIKNISSIDKNLKNDGTNSFSMGTVKYFIQQVSDNEVYIGVNENPTIYIEPDPHFFQLSGNLSSLFTIEGTGIIAQIAQLMPEVQNSKKFFSSVEEFDIHAFLDENDEIVINGTMTFPKGKMASLEFFKYLIRF